MVKTTSIITTLILSLISFDASVGQSLQSAVRQKLHPLFQSLLESGKGGPSSSDIHPAVGLSKEGETLYEAIITTTDVDAIRASGIHLNSVFGSIATAHLSRSQISSLAQSNHVRYLDPGSLNFPALDLSVPNIGASLLHSGFLNKTPYKGRGVIVLIYDTGIDWRHLDFRDPSDTTKSRILAIWDQTLNISGSGEKRPNGFNYGVEYTKEQIEDELDGTPSSLVRERDTNGHGTHVAGIAAGNGGSYFGKYVGVAPEADIIFVKGGDNSFSEARMIDGLTYAANKSAEFSKPVVVNWSIGGQSGPHDGTRGYEEAVDQFVLTPGRVVIISAGNDGGQTIHGSGILASGGSATISVNVPTYTPAYGASNDDFTIEVWFNSSVGLTATVTSPGGINVSASTNSSSSSTNKNDGDIDLYNSTGSNGKRSVLVRVRDSDSLKVPRSGVWTIGLSSLTSAATFDAWVSEASLGSSTVTIAGGNNEKTVSSPGTSDGAVTVASSVTKNSWVSANGSGYIYSSTANPEIGSISGFSSRGPTGDGRMKPDIAAPGQGIASSLSGWAQQTTSITRITLDGKHHVTQGTSMAAPHVAGAVALLLEMSRTSTAAQIKSLLTGTATTDASTGPVPNTTWGNGKLDLLSAAAKALNPQAIVQRQILAYDADGTSNIFSTYLTGTTKYAVRFTPSISGQLTGMYFNPTTIANRPIVGSGPLVCEVWTNSSGSSGGIPGARIGTAVHHPFARLTQGTNSFVDMVSAEVMVAAGQDYHLVVSVLNPQDTIKLRTDSSPAVPTNRSSLYSGGRWVNVIDPSSGISSPANLRIRAEVTSSSGLVSVPTGSEIPMVFELDQNYPNPFNPTTTIRYRLPGNSRTLLRIFDILGREVVSLVNEVQVAGQYVVQWNGKDNSSRPLSSGVYIYRLEGGGVSIARTMVLIK